MSGRVGATVMSQVGLQDFVAAGADDFVAQGLFWANNVAALAQLRAGLREIIVQSPFLKPDLIAAGLNVALRTMWQRWCAGLPAETFDVPLHDLDMKTLDPNP